jgi:predicted MPP superfamily phosphohydrolase
MSASTIRILHLSDLHERVQTAGTKESRIRTVRRDEEERGIVLGSRFLEALSELCGSEPINLVIFTGDLADWGSPEEYHVAFERFDAILRHLKVPRDRFFAVPGNHDVRRKEKERKWKQFRKFSEQTSDRYSIGRWLREQQRLPGLAASREDILLRTADFWQYYNQFRNDDMRNTDHCPVGYRYRFGAGGLGSNAVPVQIVGLDSAWSCGDDKDQGRILLTDAQVLAHIRDGKQGIDGYRIGLIHHPLDHLADGEEVRRLLSDDGLDLLLHGHQHQASSRAIVDPDSSLHIVAAGCLMEGDLGRSWPNGFQLIEVDPVQKSGTIQFRKWAKTGSFWAKGTDIYRSAPDGMLAFPVSAHKHSLSGPSGPLAGASVSLSDQGAKSSLSSKSQYVHFYQRNLLGAHQTMVETVARTAGLPGFQFSVLTAHTRLDEGEISIDADPDTGSFLTQCGNQPAQRATDPDQLQRRLEALLPAELLRRWPTGLPLTVGIHTYAWQGSPTHLRFDYGKELLPIQPENFPVMVRLKNTVNQQQIQVQFRILAPPHVAVMVGWIFRSFSDWSYRFLQSMGGREEPWEFMTPNAVAPLPEVQRGGAQREDAEELHVLVLISPNASRHSYDQWAAAQPRKARVLAIDQRVDLPDGGAARHWANELMPVIAREKPRGNDASIRLFLAVPNGLAFVLGMRLNVLGKVIVMNLNRQDPTKPFYEAGAIIDV